MLTLCQARLAYKPLLPHLLRDPLSLSFALEKSSPVPREIESQLPHISHLPILRGLLAKKQPFRPLKIGALFSGGQAPGGHNVVAALFDLVRLLNPSSQLIGFLEGPQGVIDGKWKEISAPMLSSYRNQGGFDLLGSGRTKIETEEQLRLALQTVRALSLDGLVIIGGDDSNTNAAILANYFIQNQCSVKVIGVPKTIDGDLQNGCVPIPFGFDTATKVYAEMIGNIGCDALSSKKYYHFIKLMGRSASHITLECALKTHPNLALITEERKSLAQVTSRLCDLIEQRDSMGKEYGVVLIPEGLAESMPEWSRLTEKLAKDPHGNVNVSAIETEKLLIASVFDELKRRQFKGKFTPVSHFFGYEGRAGLPSNFDATYCYALGCVAALLIAHGHTSYMAFVNKLSLPASEWGVGGVPLASLMHFEEREGKKKPVIAKALVDLHGKPYLALQKMAPEWAIQDDYKVPGPIQFFGDPLLTDTPPICLNETV